MACMVCIIVVELIYYMDITCYNNYSIHIYSVSCNAICVVGILPRISKFMHATDIEPAWVTVIHTVRQLSCYYCTCM